MKSDIKLSIQKHQSASDMKSVLYAAKTSAIGFALRHKAQSRRGQQGDKAASQRRPPRRALPRQTRANPRFLSSAHFPPEPPRERTGQKMPPSCSPQIQTVCSSEASTRGALPLPPTQADARANARAQGRQDEDQAQAQGRPWPGGKKLTLFLLLLP